MRDTSAVQLLDDDLVIVDDAQTQVDFQAYDKTQVYIRTKPEDEVEAPATPKRGSRLWMLPASLVLVCAGMLIGLLASRHQLSAPVVVVSAPPATQHVAAPAVPTATDLAAVAPTAPSTATTPATVTVAAVSRPGVHKPAATTHAGRGSSRVAPPSDAPVAAAAKVDATGGADVTAVAPPPKKDNPPADVSTSAIDKELKAAL